MAKRKPSATAIAAPMAAARGSASRSGGGVRGRDRRRRPQRLGTGPSRDQEPEQEQARQRGERIGPVDGALGREGEADVAAARGSAPTVRVAVHDLRLAERAPVAPGAPAAVEALAEHDQRRLAQRDPHVVVAPGARSSEIDHRAGQRRGAGEGRRGRGAQPQPRHAKHARGRAEAYAGRGQRHGPPARLGPQRRAGVERADRARHPHPRHAAGRQPGRHVPAARGQRPGPRDARHREPGDSQLPDPHGPARALLRRGPRGNAAARTSRRKVRERSGRWRVTTPPAPTAAARCRRPG